MNDKIENLERYIRTATSGRQKNVYINELRELQKSSNTRSECECEHGPELDMSIRGNAYCGGTPNSRQNRGRG
jgi:hypothetical protein